MMLLLDLAVRSSAVLLAGFALIALLRRKSAALRHVVLAATILAAGAVLPLRALVPAWDVSAPAAGVAAIEIPAAMPAPPATAPAVPGRPSRAVAGWLAVVWGAGTAAGLVLLLVGLVRLQWMEGRAARVRDSRWVRLADEVSRAYGLGRGVRLLQTEAPESLATWGVFRPRVILPPQARRWDEHRIRVVIGHELAHVQRQDWLVQIACELVRALYWFNPLVWLACTRLRRESEQACDDMVLGLGVAPGDYAAHLLHLARTCRGGGPAWAHVIPMARRSTLERRIAAMLHSHLDRRARSTRSLVLAAAALLAVAVPIAAVRAAQNGPLPLAGSLYDASGAVLPDVDLTLEDAQAVKVTATTDATGRFEFPSVAPGRYVLEASLPGFKKLRQALELRRADDWTLDITLQLGSVQETITVSGRRVTPAGTPRQPGTPSPVRVGGNVRPPRKLRDVKPIYPPALREAGIEGLVPLEAVIGKDGATTSVRVLSARVHPELAMAAVDAVRQWQFDPTRLNGQPVEVVMTVSVEFRLSDEQ